MVSFYNSRYQSDDAWYIEVSGVYLALDSKDIAEMPDITIKTEGKIIPSFGGKTTMGSEKSNFRFFTVGGKGVKPDLKSIEVTYKWRNKTKTDQFKTNFRTKTYGFFSNKPREYENIDPVLVANDYFWDYVKKRNEGNINSDFKQKLRSAREHQNVSIFNPSASILDHYKGFDNVLTVRMNYILSGDKNPTPGKVDGIQDFYLIEKNGVLEVIDIGTYKEI